MLGSASSALPFLFQVLRRCDSLDVPLILTLRLRAVVRSILACLKGRSLATCGMNERTSSVRSCPRLQA